jgi:hypothetical protein
VRAQLLAAADSNTLARSNKTGELHADKIVYLLPTLGCAAMMGGPTPHHPAPGRNGKVI